jgi:hypothetical protein
MPTDPDLFPRATAPMGDAANGPDAPGLPRGNVRPLADAWRRAGREPALADVLVDPLVHLVMRRDGITLPELLRAIADAQSAARRRLCARCVA